MSIILTPPVIAPAERNQGFIGLSRLHLAPLIKNDADTYTVNDAYEFPYAQSLDPPSTSGEGTKIYADDEVYLESVPQTDQTRMFTVAQLDINRLALLVGGKMGSDGSMRVSYVNPEGLPAFACSYAILLANGGGYQGVKHYVAKVSSATETQITTNDGTTKVAGWNLNFTMSGRAIDGSAIGLLYCTEYTEIVNAVVSNVVESRNDLYELISFLSDISVHDLKNDPEIGISGLSEIIVAIIETNGLDYFFVTALPVIRNAWQGIKNARGLTGTANTNL